MGMSGVCVHPKVLRKNKLENPGQPCLFLGYGKESMSYRVLDLKTGKVKELRTVEFAEDWTVEHDYVEQLLLNRYKRGKNKLPSRIPYVRLEDLTSPSPVRSRLGEPEMNNVMMNIVISVIAVRICESTHPVP